MHLPFVHELEERLHVVGTGGLEEYVAGAGMAGRRRVEQLLEVFAARRQDHLVSFELAAWNRKPSF